MGVITKAKAFIFQEPQNKNESPKVAVVIRMSSLAFMLYLLFLGISSVFLKSVGGICGGVLFLLLYAYAFSCTYQDKMRRAFILFNINTLLWVTLFFVIFGQRTGAHHFLYALILVDLFLERKRPVLMILWLYVVRVGLYLYNVWNSPLSPLSYRVERQMYILSLVLECAVVIFAGVYFTKDAFQMETRLQKYNDELRHAASTDHLTKVWNRFCMLEHVEKCLKKYRKGELQFLSVAIGDIDFFKRVNDTYGHECGDEVLKSLARLFDEEMRQNGAVARWGGEEFLFLFENMNGDDAWTALSYIQMKLNKLEIPYEDQVLHVTMTFGLAEYDFNMSLDDNIKVADDKLYKGKEGGRNRIVY